MIIPLPLLLARQAHQANPNQPAPAGSNGAAPAQAPRSFRENVARTLGLDYEPEIYEVGGKHYLVPPGSQDMFEVTGLNPDGTAAAGVRVMLPDGSDFELVGEDGKQYVAGILSPEALRSMVDRGDVQGAKLALALKPSCATALLNSVNHALTMDTRGTRSHLGPLVPSLNAIARAAIQAGADPFGRTSRGSFFDLAARRGDDQAVAAALLAGPPPEDQVRMAIGYLSMKCPFAADNGVAALNRLLSGVATIAYRSLEAGMLDAIIELDPAKVRALSRAGAPTNVARTYLDQVYEGHREAILEDDSLSEDQKGERLAAVDQKRKEIIDALNEDPVAA